MDGFLGTRGSIMLDVVVLAMIGVVPVLCYSVWLVKSRRNYLLHKRIQLTLGVALLVAVGLFEVDMRFATPTWQQRAEPSIYYGSWVYPSLVVHLCFAVPSTLLWIVVIVRALRNFDPLPQPNAHSRWHRRWGKLAAYGMILTAVTGWIFYYLAFVA